MASYSKAQYTNSGTVLAEDGETPVAWWLACLNTVLAMLQKPLGSWEHIAVSRNKMLFEVISSPNIV